MIVAGVDDAPTMAADAMQAAYFRESLADEREHLSAHLTKHREQLARRVESGSMYGLPQLRSQVRLLESDLDYIEGLIRRLDNRFGALLAARG